MNVQGLLYGDGVRVGLEDYLWMDEQRSHPASNAALVTRVIEVASVLGRSPAAAWDVRQALGVSPTGGPKETSLCAS